MSSASFKILVYVVILGSALMANAVPKAGEGMSLKHLTINPEGLTLSFI